MYLHKSSLQADAADWSANDFYLKHSPPNGIVSRFQMQNITIRIVHLGTSSLESDVCHFQFVETKAEAII